MKGRILKKLTAAALAAVLVLGTLTGCGGGNAGDTDKATEAGKTTEAGKAAETTAAEGKTTEAGKDADASQTDNGEGKGSDAAGDGSDAKTSDGSSAGSTVDGGTIIWLANLSSGPQYDGAVNYAKAVAGSMGYDFKVVYGDSFNDPNGNLSAVKNAMTKDVVAVIASQDGGIQNICDEYPELYVCGYNTAMDAVYADGGTAAALKDNDHFLGTITDGHYDGAVTGHQYAQAVIDGGYKKVATITFPGYAYPNLALADTVFRQEIEAYNETASEPIEIVGESKVLEFAPLDESWFLESGNNELDAVVALCAGTTFVYPTMKTAVADGACSENTKLLTSGFDTDESLLADIGGAGMIQYISISPVENIGWSIAMLDKALKGEMYADYTANERIDSLEYIIDSTEDVENIMSKSLLGTLDPADAQVSVEDIQACTTYADLKALFMSQQLTVDALAAR